MYLCVEQVVNILFFTVCFRPYFLLLYPLKNKTLSLKKICIHAATCVLPSPPPPLFDFINAFQPSVQAL